MYHAIMNIEEFLQYDTLQYAKPDGSTLYGETFLRLTERYSIHDFFYSFDSSDCERLNNIRQSIRSFLMEASGEPHMRRHVSDRKVAEVAGLAYYSGILDDPNPVHLYDTCGGTGIVAHLISRLRIDHHRTTADCIELNHEMAHPFDHLRKVLSLNNPSIWFSNHSVKESALPRHPDRPTYVLAKHACGDTSTDIIERFSEFRTGRATLLTCCHGKSREIPRHAARLGVTPAEWKRLTHTADWATSSDQEKKTVGRVSMRLMDGLRVIGLTAEIRACIREIVDPNVSIKNQAICLQSSDFTA